MNPIDKTKHSAEKHTEGANAVFAEATEKVAGIIENAKDKGEELIAQAKERGDEFLEDAREKGQEVWKDAKAWIRKNPGPALGCAAVAGAVLYALLRRRDD